MFDSKNKDFIKERKLSVNLVYKNNRDFIS